MIKPTIQFIDFTEADIPFIYNGLSNPAVTRYYGIHLHTLDEAAAQFQWYQTLVTTQRGRWCKLFFEQEFVGAIGINEYNKHMKSAEIGFWLLPKFWGNGIITAALEVFIQFITVAYPLDFIVAEVTQSNTRCVRLLEKNHFQLMAKTTVENVLEEGIFEDALLLKRKL